MGGLVNLCFQVYILWSHSTPVTWRYFGQAALTHALASRRVSSEVLEVFCLLQVQSINANLAFSLWVALHVLCFLKIEVHSVLIQLAFPLVHLVEDLAFFIWEEYVVGIKRCPRVFHLRIGRCCVQKQREGQSLVHANAHLESWQDARRAPNYTGGVLIQHLRPWDVLLWGFVRSEHMPDEVVGQPHLLSLSLGMQDGPFCYSLCVYLP